MYTNIEAAEELAKLYVNIPIQRIEKEWCEIGGITASRLTGFGQFQTCKLCQNVGYMKDSYDVNCSECVWSTMFPMKDEYPCMSRTYIGIATAETPRKLKEAFMERAKLLTAAIELAKRSNKVCCNEN